MFSWFRKRATEATALRQDFVDAVARETRLFFVQIHGALGGWRREMLDDPFIVGAIANHAVITCAITTNAQCPQVIIEAAMIEGVQEAFLDTPVSREEAIAALMKFKNHPDYMKAAQAVTLILGAKFERRDLVSDPLVADARQRLREMPKAFREAFGASEPEQTASMLLRNLLIKPIKDRYGDLWAQRHGG